MGRKKVKAAPAPADPAPETPAEEPEKTELNSSTTTEKEVNQEEKKEDTVGEKSETEKDTVEGENETKKDAVEGESEGKKDTVEENKKKKPVKKTVPDWASLSDSARKSLPRTQMAKPKVQDSIIAAITACRDSKGREVWQLVTDCDGCIARFGFCRVYQEVRDGGDARPAQDDAKEGRPEGRGERTHQTGQGEGFQRVFQGKYSLLGTYELSDDLFIIFWYLTDENEL